MKTLPPIPTPWPERGRGGRRAIGLLGLIVGAALPPVAVSGAPRPVDRSVDRTRDVRCCVDFFHVPIEDWAPYVEPRAPGDAETCLPPGEAGAERFLVGAPKPEGYVPQAVEPDRHHACLRVAPEGHVDAVRLSGRIEAGRAAMIRTILGWRFQPAGARSWVRVRLSARYGTSIPPPDGPL